MKLLSFIIAIAFFCIAFVLAEPNTTVPATTTTTAPATTPKAGLPVNKYNVTENSNGTVCLLANFAAQFVLKGTNITNTWDVDESASVDETRSHCNRLVVVFTNGEFVIEFDEEKKSTFVSGVTANLKHPDMKSTASNLTEAKTTEGSSYLCTAGINIDMSHNVTFKMTKVQLQPYSVKGGTFGTGVAAEDDKKQEHWIYSDGNKTYFMADVGIEWGVTYEKSDGKTPGQKVISFGMESKFTATKAVGTIDVTIQEAGNLLDLTFKLDKGNYWLENVTLTYKADEKIFPDAAYHENVTLSGNMVKLFQSKEKMSYLCSIESQMKLSSSEKTVTNAYINFMPSESAKALKMQVFTFSSNDTYDNASSCSWDSRDLTLDLQKFVLKKDDKTVCAMVETMLSLELMYNTISGKGMTTTIPVKTTTDVTGSCDKENVTTMAIALNDKVGTVTLGFGVQTEKMFSYSDVQIAVLNSLQLDYDPTTVYFPNHESNNMQTVKNASLCEFSTAMGSSYQCLALSRVNVTKDLTAMFNQTKMQAFGIKDGNFSKVDADCQAKPVMNTTTPAKTTQMPATTTAFIPIPVQPTISERTIVDSKDGNKTCLHGDFGLQLYITYNSTKGMEKVVAYNFDAINVTTTATCYPSNATILFHRNYDGVEVTLTFMKTKTSSYLSSITAKYDNKNFPDHKKDKTTAKDLTMQVHNFDVPSNNSYQCKEGTDIFISNADDFVALRLDGLILDVIPKQKDYSPASKCFRDIPATKAASANFFINSTDSKGQSYVCAAFTMTINAMVMYPQLVNENMRTVYIEIPGNNDTASDPSSGMCDDKKNSTTLRIPMDDGKVVFVFTFKKQNTSNSVLTAATLQYQTDSKYFPNHAHVSGNVSQSNVSLNLFPTPENYSYKCNKNVSIVLEHGKIFMADVQVQPSGVTKSDGSFSAAKDCATNDLNPIIPIIVGAVLAGLVVIVLIAYVVGKRRNNSSSYESL